MPLPRAQEDRSDEALVSDALDGDRAAFTQLYHRHAPSVATLVDRSLAGNADVDEVVQETFVAAHRQLDQLRDRGHFGAWTRGIALNLVRQRIGRRRRWHQVLRTWVMPEPSPPPNGEARAALASLPPKLRMPFVLHRLEGHTIEETADLCDISPATTKRRCAEASRRLARRLA